MIEIQNVGISFEYKNRLFKEPLLGSLAIFTQSSDMNELYVFMYLTIRFRPD